MPYAQVPGARLHFDEAGRGTPIVFVHETMADSRSFEQQVRWFSRQYRCITYDARGYAPSERGSDPSTHDHLVLADDIGHIMDAAGVQRAYVVGISMGAYVTAHFAVRHPQRVLGMVLCGLGAGADEPKEFAASTLAMAAVLEREGMQPVIAAQSRTSNRVQLLRKDPRGWNEYLQHLGEIDPVTIANILRYCHSRRPPIYQLEAQLRTLDVPALIAVGDEDAPSLQPALFLKRSLARSGIWICPCTGHAVNLEEPALFNAAVQSFFDAVERDAWQAHAR